MKIKERLAYMAFGGVFVIAGMILGQFMFGPVYAQKNTSVSERPDADFGVIRCKRIIVGDDVLLRCCSKFFNKILVISKILVLSLFACDENP